MGSVEIMNLEYQQGFSFIGVSGDKKAVNEKRSASKAEEVQVTQIFAVNKKFQAEELSSKTKASMEYLEAMKSQLGDSLEQQLWMCDMSTDYEKLQKNRLELKDAMKASISKVLNKVFSNTSIIQLYEHETKPGQVMEAIDVALRQLIKDIAYEEPSFILGEDAKIENRGKELGKKMPSKYEDAPEAIKEAMKKVIDKTDVLALFNEFNDVARFQAESKRDQEEQLQQQKASETLEYLPADHTGRESKRNPWHENE